MKKKALITGITGQDGSYLAEYLLSLGYEVHGLVRRVAMENPEARMSRILPIMDRLVLHSGSLESYPSLYQILSRAKFDEIYHLAAQSFVAESFEDGFSTMNINSNGTHYLLAALHGLQPECRFYFAGSSEMFGKVRETPQRESTPFHPRSPYGISKVTGYYLTMNYREAYDMFTCSGILFNHESPRRGFEFVSRKTSTGAARIKAGLQKELCLGNLEARRDWGFAGDYVRAMHTMLQRPTASDYVIGMGETHSVREFCEIAFRRLNLDWQEFVRIDPLFYRPAEVDLLIADPSRARSELGWKPTLTFEQLVTDMVENDMRLLGQAGDRLARPTLTAR
jgi:GDPmannose 4,6-dehydratase